MMFEKEELEVILEDVNGFLESCYRNINNDNKILYENQQVDDFDLDSREVVIRQIIVSKVKEELK